jgi:hypothetical protein
MLLINMALFHICISRYAIAAWLAPAGVSSLRTSFQMRSFISAGRAGWIVMKRE